LMHKPTELGPTEQIALPGLDQSPPDKRLRIHYAWTSRPWDGRFLPQFKSVPNESVAYTVFRDGDAGSSRTVRGEEDWTDVGGLGPCRVEAVKMQRESVGGAVLCLITAVD